MTAPSQVSVALNDSREQWRSNPRLRYGVFIIIGILWFYLILVLRDSVVAKRDAWIAAEARIARARVLANSGDWVNRASDVKGVMTEYENLLWKEGSLGVAQAAVQESVNRALAAAGLTARSVRVAVSDAPLSPEMTEIVPIRARVSVDFRPTAVNNWFAAMAKDVSEKKPALVVESLSIRGAPTPVAEVEIIAYALRPEAISGISATSAISATGTSKADSTKADSTKADNTNPATVKPANIVGGVVK